MPPRPKNARGKGDGDSRLDPHCARRVPWSSLAIAVGSVYTNCETDQTKGEEILCADLVKVPKRPLIDADIHQMSARTEVMRRKC
jgi:hypothetical protein